MDLHRTQFQGYYGYMSNEKEQQPFTDLGGKLKKLRQAQKESLAEAAGAVELAEEDLLRIEQGYERPSEEILMLLIKHFKIVEDEALRLWELAGYDEDEGSEDASTHSHGLPKSIVMTIAMDPRVMYSDNVVVNGSKNGIIFTFLQPGNASMSALPISRIGMSREQAQKMLVVLKDTLDYLDSQDTPKELPPTTD